MAYLLAFLLMAVVGILGWAVHTVLGGGYEGDIGFGFARNVGESNHPVSQPFADDDEWLLPGRAGYGALHGGWEN